MKKNLLLFLTVMLFLFTGVLSVKSATLNVPGSYATIQAAVAAANPGDEVLIASGTHSIGSSIIITVSNLTITGSGVGSTYINVNISAGIDVFQVLANGFTLQNVEMIKTDKNGVQNLIWINANNVSILNNSIHGQFVIGDGEVSRALVVSGGLTGLLIQGNTFYALRQPAYVTGTTNGNVTNNFTYSTKGWVLEGGNLTFAGNTWGTGTQANVYDIAIIPAMPAIYYTSIVAVSTANNDAVIEDQRVSPAVLSVAHVDGSTSYSSDMGGRYHPYASIIPALARVVAGGTIYVAAGNYNEEFSIPKALLLKGAGWSATTISGPINGIGSTIQVNASNVLIDGFTITRDGNNVANWNLALNTAGVAIQGQTFTNAEISNCNFFGNRTAIDINNSNGHNIHDNIVSDNRSGILFRNQTDYLIVKDNTITNNWTVGVLFLDGSGGTNVPVQTAANCLFEHNNISGNWYGQVVDRQIGGSLLLPGNNMKNFEQNYWGTMSPVVSTNNSTEPGYAAQIPVIFGGTAVAPGGQPDILGPASANIDYEPWCNSNFTQCNFAYYTPTTTIETPSYVSCGVYDVDVKVSDFTNIGAASLILNYDPAVFSYQGVDKNPALTTAYANGATPGKFILGDFPTPAITLAADAVLFTLHFKLLPAIPGPTSLTWSSVSGECEYAGPGGEPIYVSTFNDLVWTIPARPVKNTTTLLEYCTIQEAINAIPTLATHTLTVDAALYTAKEQVFVNKEVKIQGINGQPLVEFLGTVTGKPTLFDVSANNVTIDNIHFNVDLAKLRSAIVATSAGLDNIIITNNVIDCYGNPAGSYGERNAVSVNYAAYRVATGGVDNITFTGNTVNAGTYPIMFRSGISVDEGEGTFSGNTLKTINQDILVRFAASGNVTVFGNHSNGGGMEFTDFNAGTGTLSVTGNFFNGTFANTYSNALRLKNNYTGRTTVVSGNDFTGFEGNVAGYGGTLSLENYQAVTLDANTFTPLAGSTVYRHLTINTKEFSSSSGFYAPVIGATFTNNIFNGSGVLGGTALAFYNWDNDAPTFNAITIGTAGNENIFNNDIQKFIMLDNSTGTVAPNGTTMVPWAVNLNAEHNKFAMSPPILPSAMTLAELFALEDKIDHKIDNKSLGFVTVKASNAYVTDMASATAINNDYTRIRNAVELVANNWTINLHGTFDWTEANAAASWALGNDGVTGNDDDYTILVPAGLTGVTFTAPEGLGSVTIQGPGDLAGANLEGTLNFWLGNNQNWTISNLEIFDFDLGIGMFYKNTTDFNNLAVTNNHIRIPKDLNTIVAPADVNQNIGIHYAFGTNQTFSNNIFDVEGDGVSNGTNYSTSIVMQSNTSGGAVYDGLKIKDNTINVTGIPDATNPAVIRGIWENGANSNSSIEISGNLFSNSNSANTANLNRQVAFWITSVSGATKKVEYKNNEISGFSEGIAWIGGAYTSYTPSAFNTGQFPVELMNNKFDGMKNAVVVRKAVTSTNTGSPALIKNNSFTNLVSGGLSVKNEGTGDAVSTCNWFGTTVPAAIAAQISGTATHIPWLYDGTDLLPATRGFQPSVVCDETPPVITCPANVTVNQHDARDPYATGYATVTIPADVITFDDNRAGLNLCNSTGVIIRTWTANDLAGNNATCNQTITVQDVDIPVVVAPANITVNTDPGQCSAVVNYIDPTATDFGYFQGFENVAWVAAPYATNPSTDWNKYPGPIARVASGTDLITSKSGSAHAVITEDSEGTGVFSRLGGYNNVFGNGFVTSVDVYLDVNDSKVGTSTYGWEVTSAVSNQATGHLRDFVFHAAGVPGKIVIAATNNASNARRNDLASINHHDVTTSGWYTLKWTFRNNTGVLAVDCQLLNAGGSVLWTETRTAPTDLIASVVGGNRYMWFTFLAVDKLAIDNTTLTRNLAVTPASLSGTAFNKGVNTITANTTDACGHAGTNSFTITVNDNEKPLITCAPDVTINCEDSQDPTVNTSLGSATATDNCGTPTVTYSDAPGQVYRSTDPAPSYDIQARARNGNSGFEGVVFTPGNPSPTGVQLNPVGTPAWNYSQYHNVEFNYTAATGTLDWKIDFNRDSDFLDAQEMATSVSPTLVGKGFKYVGFYMNGTNASVFIDVQNLTINGTNVGSFLSASNGSATDQYYQNSAGMFADITVTASIRISGSGSSEVPRLWIRAGVPMNVSPAPTCPQNYTINRVWKATDAIGNQSMCIQNITVHDVTPPVLAAAPAPVSVQCIGDVPAMTSLSWTDNCDAGGSVAGVDGPLVGGNCGGTITRTWNVSDACGNPAITRTQIITIQHTILPIEIGGPVATASTVECEASATAPGTLPVVEDICGNALTPSGPTKQLSFTNKFDAPVILGATPATGVWYTDRYNPAGFTSPVVFDGGNRLRESIAAADFQANSFNNTQGRAYDLGATTNSTEIKLYVPASWEFTNKRLAGFWGVAVDAASAVSGYPIVEFTSDGNNPRFRVWESNGANNWVDLGLPAGFAYDTWTTLKIRLLPSGEFLLSAGSLNYVTSTSAPDASVRLKSVILQGYNHVPLDYDIYWDDFTYNDTYAPVTCEGAISYTYDYADCSGLPYSWVYTYTIDHVTAPVVPANGTITVSCLADAVAPTLLPAVVDQQQLSVNTGLLTPYWNNFTSIGQSFTCGSSGWLTKLDVKVGTITAPLSFTLQIYQGNGISGALLYSGSQSLSSTGWQSLNIAQNVAPYLTAGQQYTFWLTSFTYNQLGLFFMYPNAYNGGVSMDGCTSGCASPYAWQQWPDYDLTFKTYMAVVPVVTDVCGLVIPAPTPVQSGTYDGCEGTKVYTYSYTDCADLSSDWVYTYTIERNDFTMPANPAPVSVACYSAIAALLPTPPAVTDNCSNSLTPTGPVESTPPACEGNVTYTWTYTDCELNTHDWVATFTIERLPFTDPTDAGQTVACVNLAVTTTAYLPTVTDNCGNTLTPGAPTTGGTYDGCEGTKTYTYLYADCEGNTHDWVYTYTIERLPFTDPTDAGITIGSGALAVVPTLPVVTDNCGNLLIPAGPTIGGTFNGCTGTITYTYIYTDCEGNTNDWIYTYTVVTNTLSGTLKYNNSAKTPMNNVTLTLTPGGATSTTDGSGNYSFPGLCAGSYTITVTTNNKAVGGINSTDAGAVNYWGANYLTLGAIEHVKFLAGDVSGNNFVAAIDALGIQNYFVYGTPFNRTTLTGTPWSYWKSGDLATNIPVPPTSFTVNVAGDVLNYGLYAQCTGDFNGSFTPSAAKSIASSLVLTNGGTMVAGANQEFELPLRTQSEMDVSAVSLILDIPSAMTEVMDVKVNGSNDPVTWTLNGNELRIGWNSTIPVNIPADGNLVILKLKTTGAFTNGNSIMVNLVADPLNELADANYNVIENAVLVVNEVVNGMVGIADQPASDLLSLSNYPNPFSKSTTVTYEIPYDGKVTLEVHTMLGQLVKTLVDETQAEGKYSLKVDGSTLKPGFYSVVLRLKTTEGVIDRSIKFVVNQ